MAKIKTIKIEDDVMSVLKLSTIEGNTLKLPPQQLHRDTYTRVDKVLRAAGGKWNRRLGAHEFPSSPAELLSLDQGVVVDVKQTYQIFETHPSVAAQLVADLGVPHGASVLEPSAGSGAMVRALTTAGYRVTAIEIRPGCASDIMRAGAVKCTTADFLTVDPTGIELFDAVLMNPPFSGGQDVMHVEHAMRFLRPGGTLISIMSAGVLHNKQYADFRDRFRWMGGVFIEFPPKSFQHAGTGVDTIWLRVTAAT